MNSITILVLGTKVHSLYSDAVLVLEYYVSTYIYWSRYRVTILRIYFNNHFNLKSYIDNRNKFLLSLEEQEVYKLKNNKAKISFNQQNGFYNIQTIWDIFLYTTFVDITLWSTFSAVF